MTSCMAGTAADAQNASHRDACLDVLATRLQEAAQGNGEAFACFYDLSVGKARTVARRFLRGADVEDLLADAFFEAWRNASSFDGKRGNALTWLLCIVRSRSLDQIRRNRVHPSVGGADTDTHDEQADASPGPLELAARSQESRRLHEAFDTLPVIERCLVGLAYHRELSHSEIAVSTGLPLGTVKSHLNRAQKRLRTAMIAAPAAQARGACSP
jgi:RNA polymerase sigma-70 factor, ECF subfamily